MMVNGGRRSRETDRILGSAISYRNVKDEYR
jgi:hypothetical protein